MKEFLARICEKFEKERELSIGVHASVALILRYRQGGLETFFIKRADSPGDPWAGHIAFPGGKREEIDEDLLATVCREVYEEVGFSLLIEEHYLGALPSIRKERPYGSLFIHPFIFLLNEEQNLKLDANEVAEVFWVSWADILDSRHKVQVSVEGGFLSLAGVKMSENILWGMTYGIFSEYLRRFFQSSPIEHENLEFIRKKLYSDFKQWEFYPSKF